VRVRTTATIAGARIAIQVDIGFGDAVTPAPVEIDYPTLLDAPAPHLRACPVETVVAEKFEALANALGRTREMNAMQIADLRIENVRDIRTGHRSHSVRRTHRVHRPEQQWQDHGYRGAGAAVWPLSALA
jgi:hypothetical protein